MSATQILEEIIKIPMPSITLENDSILTLAKVPERSAINAAEKLTTVS
jgi:hypothetical protein